MAITAVLPKSLMNSVIVNVYAADRKNIGDLASAPVNYFSFPGHRVETLDIRVLDPKFPLPNAGFGGTLTLDDILSNRDVNYHFIVGGGGLVFQQFLGCFEQIKQLKSEIGGIWVAWGIGQQVYPWFKDKATDTVTGLTKAQEEFNYQPYLAPFDLIGIRDFGFQHNWLPCASCMDPAFDKKRDIKHDFVVFSHRKFQIKFGRYPRMTNDEPDTLEEVLDFLGTGETILTSSFHGAYWGLLLGRKVLAFPFSTKFLTLNHKPGIYPVKNWIYPKFKFRPFKKTFLNKLSFEFDYGDGYFCDTSGWRELAKSCQTYPNLLQTYRDHNVNFYQQVMEKLAIA